MDDKAEEKNVKAAIVTLFGFFNYGNRLQNYALHKALEDLGAEVCTWNVSRDQNLLKRILRPYVEKVDGKRKLKSRQERTRERNFKRFSDRYIAQRLFYCADGRIPEHADGDIDLFVVGSDQVWNPLFWRDSDESEDFYNFFLRFTRKKKVAYAASFGIPALPEQWQQRMEPLFGDFSAISVRETEGKQILDQMGYEADVVLDPTMLLTAQQWRQVEEGHVTNPGDYILTYFLGSQPAEILEKIYQNARTRGKTIVDLLDVSSGYYCMGPETFVELIDKADTVYTDSFHAAVFSILFHTPFAVFERRHKNQSSMSSRITTLLSCVGIEDGISTDCFKVHRNFDQMEEKLDQARTHAWEFLKNVFGE